MNSFRNAGKYICGTRGGREGINKEEITLRAHTTKCLKYKLICFLKMHCLATTTELHISYFEDLCRKVFTFHEVILKLRGFSKTLYK